MFRLIEFENWLHAVLRLTLHEFQLGVWHANPRDLGDDLLAPVPNLLVKTVRTRVDRLQQKLEVTCQIIEVLLDRPSMLHTLFIHHLIYS